MSDLDYNIKTTADVGGINKTSEATKELKEQKRGLIDQLKILRRELPGVSEAIHLIKNPAVAAAVAIGYVITAFRAYLEKVKEAEQAVAPFENITKTFGRFRSVAAEATARGSEFAHELAKVGEAADTAETHFKALNDQIQHQAKLVEELRAKQLELSKEQIHADQASGKISPLEATRRLTGLDASAGAAARARSLALGASGLAALHGQISQTESHQALAEQALPGASANVSDVTARARASKKLADATAAFADTREKLLKEEQAGLQDDPQGKGKARYAEITQELLKLVQDRDDAETIRVKATASIAAAEKEEKELTEKILADKKKLQELNAQRLQVEQELNAQFQANRTLGGLDAGIAASKFGAAASGAVGTLAGEALSQRTSLSSNFAHGVPNTQAAIAQFNQTLSDLREALGALGGAANFNQAVAAQLRQLGFRVDALQRQIQNPQ